MVTKKQGLEGATKIGRKREEGQKNGPKCTWKVAISRIHLDTGSKTDET